MQNYQHRAQDNDGFLVVHSFGGRRELVNPSNPQIAVELSYGQEVEIYPAYDPALLAVRFVDLGASFFTVLPERRDGCRRGFRAGSANIYLNDLLEGQVVRILPARMFAYASLRVPPPELRAVAYAAA